MPCHSNKVNKKIKSRRACSSHISSSRVCSNPSSNPSSLVKNKKCVVDRNIRFQHNSGIVVRNGYGGGRVWLVSFNSIMSRAPKLITTQGLPPYIDSSCRREPDLESEFPSITALCRKDLFAPKIKVGDIIVYITRIRTGEYKLVAILKATYLCNTHKNAANYYSSLSLKLPSNCMVPGNYPKPLDQTDNYRICLSSNDLIATKILYEWDFEYWKIADSIKNFVICESIYKELYRPLSVFRTDFINKLGRMPGTQNPTTFSISEFQWLFDKVNVRIS